jgi:Cys-tRNA(Pro) deacylase
MAKVDYPVTPAIRVLRERKIPFEPYVYEYEEKGGTRASSLALNVPEHEVIKTLVMETDERTPLLVLMHGDKEVSTQQLARFLNVKRVEPCDAGTAQKTTGYQFGGTSPFGTRVQLPVYAESSIFLLSKMYINGGKRGFLVGINPNDMLSVLNIIQVEVAI